jgi:hypothetical protein
MRASSYDDNITRRIADRLIARLAAQRGLSWQPAPVAGTPASQPDLFHAEVIVKGGTI